MKDCDLPLACIIDMKKTEINISLKYIEEAGLLNEFIEFTTSENSFGLQKWEDYFTEFAKKYPEKFQITPEHEKVEYCVYMQDGQKQECKIPKLKNENEILISCLMEKN